MKSHKQYGISQVTKSNMEYMLRGHCAKLGSRAELHSGGLVEHVAKGSVGCAGTRGALSRARLQAGVADVRAYWRQGEFTNIVAFSYVLVWCVTIIVPSSSPPKRYWNDPFLLFQLELLKCFASLVLAVIDCSQSESMAMNGIPYP